MVKFTVEQLENPPTVFGILQGDFGVRVFYNQQAGIRAIEDLSQFLSGEEQRKLKDLVLCDRKLPVHGETVEMEELVAEALPTNYVM